MRRVDRNMEWPAVSEGVCRECGNAGRRYASKGMCIVCRRRPETDDLDDVPSWLGNVSYKRSQKKPLEWLGRSFGKTYVETVLEHHALDAADEVRWDGFKCEPDVEDLLREECDRLMRAAYRRWATKEPVAVFIIPEGCSDPWAVRDGDLLFGMPVVGDGTVTPRTGMVTRHYGAYASTPGQP